MLRSGSTISVNSQKRTGSGKDKSSGNSLRGGTSTNSLNGSMSRELSHSTGGGGGEMGDTVTLVVSGGDGYEDFRYLQQTETVGREDSTNHLIVWRL